MRKRGTFVLGVLMLSAVCAGLWLRHSASDKPPSAAKPAEHDAANDLTRRLRSRPDDTHQFVGSEKCASCHAEIAAHYLQSGMSQTWRSVSGTDGQLANPDAQVSDTPAAFSYQVLPTQDGLLQRELMRGNSDWYRDIAARYRIGSGKHAFSLAAEENGYLTQLPLAWYAHDGQWGLSPGYELQNRRFTRSVRSECIACHGGETRQEHAVVERFDTPIGHGISCERCHGPGKEHVTDYERRHEQALPEDIAPAINAGQAETAISPATMLTDPLAAAIINPGHLDAERANDVCLQCHLQGDAIIFQPGCDAFTFRPGDRLRDHRLDFLAESAESSQIGVASHGARMLQSRCWTESGGRLTCILCHDAHRPVDAVSFAEFDRKCLTCHQQKDCHRVSESDNKPAVESESNCVSCHMPQRPTREGTHLVFTDHLIRNPSPADDIQQESADLTPTVIPPDSDVVLVDSRSDQPVDELMLAAAYVQLHESMGPQRKALGAGVQILEDLFRRNPDNAEVRYWLGSARISQRRGKAAVDLLRPVVAANPDWFEARFRLAVAYDQNGSYSQAMPLYQSLIQDLPAWPDPYPLLSRLQLFKQDASGAMTTLQQQLELREDAEARAAMALAFRIRGEPLERSLQQIQLALDIDPTLQNALLNRAFLLAEAGYKAEAERDFRAVLKQDPQHVKARAGLQSLLMAPPDNQYKAQ